MTHCQWGSHSGGGGGMGAVCPPTAKNLAKIGKKREKIRKNQEKEGQIGKRGKSGRFFHFAPPDR